VFATTYFLPPISTLIKAYKYKPYPDLGAWIGEWLYEVISLPEITCITWVPLHSTKLKARGFNQTEKIAKALAKKLNLPCLELCLKTQATAPQATITDKTERLTHPAESFMLAPTWQKPDHQAWLKQQKILIVDDVITTGATLSAVAEPLAKIGCSEIYGLAVAHGQ
jgi:predicted amidophosphoribosyltransferase